MQWVEKVAKVSVDESGREPDVCISKFTRANHVLGLANACISRSEYRETPVDGIID